MNEHVKQFCKQHDLTEEQFYGRKKIEGGLHLDGLTSIPESFNPTVGGGLYLNGLTSIPESFNPTVGWSLYLDGLTSIPESFNPTVGWDLYLNGLTSIPESFNPTVGGDLYLNGLTSDKTLLPKNYIFSWQNGKYIKADGIFAEVLSKKKNIYQLRKIGKQERFYMIVSDDGRIAHGETIEEAREDLIYKITDRKKSDYEGLTLDDELTFGEAIACYRTITGACSFGVKDFVRTRLDSKLKERKEKYSIREIIEVTTGEYGGDIFRDFFVKGDVR